MASPPDNNGVGLVAGPASEGGPGTVEGQKGAPGSPEPAASTAANSDSAAVTDDNGVNPLEFDGSVDSNHDLPTPETIRKIDKYVVLDRDGKSHTFRSLYTGRHTARRVLIIFIRHFYCGNCQEYLRTLAESITPDALLRLPLPTFIAVIGCGDPALIDMYVAATGCPFPIYTDPTSRLYIELGMIRSLTLGVRPAYTHRHLLKGSVLSVVQGLRQIPSGLAFKGGDFKQIGGEFLFEPAAFVAKKQGATDGVSASAVTTPVAPSWEEVQRQPQEEEREMQQQQSGESGSRGQASLDGKGEPDDGEDKVVTWCHRMKTTRDHTEIPELMEVLGLDGHGRPIEDKERWERALRERKGTGVSLAGKIREMEAKAGTA